MTTDAPVTRRYLTVTETAKLLRQALRAAFPGVKFSVRSRSYAGGASIDVGWVDGPFAADVDVVAHRYAGATFDGMIDMKTHHDSLVHFAGDDLPTTVSFGADYVFVQRQRSPAYNAQLTGEAETALGIPAGTFNSQTNYGQDVHTPYGSPRVTWTFGTDLLNFLAAHVIPAQEGK